MSNVVRIDPLGRAREEACGVHDRAMVERRQRELVAIYKNRRARIAATRWAWCVRMVVAGVIGLAAGHVATLRFAEPLLLRVTDNNEVAWRPAGDGDSRASAARQLPPMASPAPEPEPVASAPAALAAPAAPAAPAALAGTLPAHGETPKPVAVPQVPAMPTGRPGQDVATGRAPAAQIRPPAPKEHQADQRGTGVYEAPQARPPAQKEKAPDFKVIEIPADGVALIQQGSVIKPVRVGERFPDNTLLKSALPEAAGVETSGGRLLIDRKPHQAGVAGE